MKRKQRNRLNLVDLGGGVEVTRQIHGRHEGQKPVVTIADLMKHKAKTGARGASIQGVQDER